MVSSKCCAVVSPSPLRFLAALMPPCAHTECERLTGTMEKRSTLPPASAILMTAASPASPPPTTMILGAAMIWVVPSLFSPPRLNPLLLFLASMPGLKPRPTSPCPLTKSQILCVCWFLSWMNFMVRDGRRVLEGRGDPVPCVDENNRGAEPGQFRWLKVSGDGGVVFVGDVVLREAR